MTPKHENLSITDKDIGIYMIRACLGGHLGKKSAILKRLRLMGMLLMNSASLKTIRMTPKSLKSINQ